MLIRQIESLDTLELRLAILRPRGSIKDCMFPGDDHSSTKHFGAFRNKLLIGVVSIYNRRHENFNGKGYQIRAMATLEQERGKGVGSKLLKRTEEYALANNADYIWANARVLAKDFYLKSHYHLDDTEFNIENVGLHVLVSKTYS